MQNELEIVSIFPSLRLSKRQIKLLKKTDEQELSLIQKIREKFDTHGGLFLPPEINEPIGNALTYTGRVPYDVLYLTQLTLLEPVDLTRNPHANDGLDKIYIISDTGKMYLQYLKNEKTWKTLPLIISIISLIFSLINLIGFLYSLHRVLQVHLI